MDKIVTVIKTIPTWPVVRPVWALAHSRSFIVLTLSILANLVVPQIPNLSASRAEIIGNAIFYGGGILLTGLQLQNLIEARSAAPTTASQALLSVAGQLADEVSKEMTPPQPPTEQQIHQELNSLSAGPAA